MSEASRSVKFSLLEVAIPFVPAAAYLFWFTRLLHRIGDEGTIVYGAQRVIEGAIPYRDFVEVIGPGSFYWLALFFKVFGNTWQVSRFSLLLTAVSTSLLVYWIARQYLNRTASVVPWFFALILGVTFWPACNHHWDSNLFGLAAVACFLERGRKHSSFWLAGTGFLAGLTSCFIQQKGFYLLIALLLVLVIGRPRPAGRHASLKFVTILVAPYITVLGIVALLFYYAGALPDLIYCTFLRPFSMYHNVNAGICWKSIGVALRPAALYFRVLPIQIALLFQALCVLPFILVVSLPLFTIALAAASRRGAALLASSELALILPAMALWFSEIHRMDIYHCVYGSPLLVVVLVYLVEKMPAYRVRKAILSAVAVPLIALAIGWLWDARMGYSIQTRRGMILDAESDDALRFINSNVPKREWVFVYPYYPMYYYLADIRNPTRFSILVYNYNSSHDFNEVIDDLKNRHVKFVLWDTMVDGANLSTWFPGYTQPPASELKLEHYLNASYELISTKNGFRILRLKE